MARTGAKLVTAEELLSIPREDYRGYRYELIHGRLMKTRRVAGIAHGVYARKIAANLLAHANEHNLGMVVGDEVAFRLTTNPKHVRISDVGFMRQERVGPLDEMAGILDGAPDLAVEVISPFVGMRHVAEKVKDWLHHGARMIIVVNSHNRTAQKHTLDGTTELTEADTLDGGDVVPGWSMPVADIFA